jgi:HK97 family phage major capsid protein
VLGEGGDDLDFTKVTSLEGSTAGKVESFQAMMKEINDLGVLRDQRKELEESATKVKSLNAFYSLPAGEVTHPSGDAKPGVSNKSIGQLFVESPAYKEFKGRSGPQVVLNEYGAMEMKTVFRTGAGFEPENLRTGRIELDPQRPISVIDFIPMAPINSDAIRYMEQTTFTNNAVETAESTATTDSDLIGEAALAYTERTQVVEWLPVFIPVTLQQMEDVEGIATHVDQQLAYMLRARLDSQILNGDGVTPNILGTVNVVGINTQALAGDPIFDAIHKGINLVRTVGFTEPSVIFAHPTDWQEAILTRTADGLYILGSPRDPGVERVWGIPVVPTTAVVENTIVLGDYTGYATLHTKRGITIEVSDSHQAYFTRGMLAIRADMRIAMVHRRPEAFCTITGV